jgi:hypothetical protein
MWFNKLGRMETMDYESPRIVKAGSIRELTLGQVFATGQDSFNTVLNDLGYGGPNLFGS